MNEVSPSGFLLFHTRTNYTVWWDDWEEWEGTKSYVDLATAQLLAARDFQETIFTYPHLCDGLVASGMIRWVLHPSGWWTLVNGKIVTNVHVAPDPVYGIEIRDDNSPVGELYDHVVRGI